MNPQKRDTRSGDGWVIAGLALAALILRLPFMTRYLYHWDSVNFALSLSHYDVRMHQPHPPGYVLYSALGALVNGVLNDPNASLVWLSVAGGMAGVVALYWAGGVLFSRRVGFIAALLGLTSPSLWFHSEIALTYALEFALVTVIAVLCYKQLTGDARIWLLLAVALGITGGVRQNDLAFLLPLWLVSLWPLTWKQRALSALALAGVCLAWLVPMVALSGGPSGFLAAFSSASDVVYTESSIFGAGQSVVNAARLLIYIGYGVLLGGLALAIALVAHLRQIPVWLRDRRAWVLALWITPALLFYLFIHVRQPGHVFTFLPAVILLIAVAIEALADRWFGRQQKLVSAAMAGVIAATNVAFFLFAPASLFGSGQLPLQTMSRRTLTQRDQLLAERLTFVRERFDPATTVVFAGGLDFRHMDFYLQDFQAPSISHELGSQTVTLPPAVNTLVLFNEQSLPALQADVPAEMVTTPGGATLRYYHWAAGSVASLSQQRLTTRAEASRRP